MKVCGTILRPERKGRTGVSGVLAAVILFVLIFTVGAGFFLYINNQLQNNNQAFVNRANNQLQSNSEKLTIKTAMTGASDPHCQNCLWIRANNTGGIPVTIVDLYITCISPSNVCKQGELVSQPSQGSPSYFIGHGSRAVNESLPLTLPVGGSTKFANGTCGTNGCRADIAIKNNPTATSDGWRKAYQPGPPAEYVTVSVLTSRGNVFTAQYPYPNQPSQTYKTVVTQSTQVVASQIGGGPQLNVLLQASTLCPSGSPQAGTFACTQTFTCDPADSSPCIQVTATVYNLATTTALGAQFFLNTPPAYVSGTATVTQSGSCSPSQNILGGQSATYTCLFYANTGQTGGLAAFSGYASATLYGVTVASSGALSNPVEIGGLASVPTQGAFVSNFFYFKYSSCFQNNGNSYSSPCTTNSPLPLSTSALPNGNYLAGGSNFYTAYYVQVTNVFNTTLPITQYSYTFGDPTVSSEVFFFLAGINGTHVGNLPAGDGVWTNNVYYPYYSSNTPVLASYPSDCATNVNGIPTDTKCLYVKPGQSIILTFAACGYGTSTMATTSTASWEWGGQQDAGGFDSGSSGCDAIAPAFTVPEGMVLGIVMSYQYKGATYTQLMPFEGQAILRSDSTVIGTSPTFVCNPAPTAVGNPTTCTATVTDNDGGNSITPTGTVTFTASPSIGTFGSNPCALSQVSQGVASCSVTFTPTSLGTATITATYNGDIYHIGSSGTSTLNIGVIVPLTCTMQNTAPAATLSLSSTGWTPSLTTVPCDGAVHNVFVQPSSTLTATEPTDLSTSRERFIGNVTSVSDPVCATGTCAGWSFNNWEELLISFTVAPTGGGTTNPAWTNVWTGYGQHAISAAPASGYHFNQWTSSTGSITFTSATSASTTATIHAGGSITANFGRPKSIDSTCVGFGSVAGGNSWSLTLPSCQANDVIILVITQGSTFSRTFTISDSANALTFTIRGAGVFSSSIGIYEYWATNSVALTNDKISISTSFSHNYDAEAFGVIGPSTTSPFDSNGGLPYSNTGNSGTPTVTGVFTSNTNDIIIGLEGDSSGTTETQGTGFTLLATHGPNSLGLSIEYEIVSSTLGSATVNFGTSASNWAMIVDAIDPPATAPSASALPSNSSASVIFFGLPTGLGITVNFVSISGRKAPGIRELVKSSGGE